MAANTSIALYKMRSEPKSAVVYLCYPEDHDQVVWTSEKVKIEVGWPCLDSFDVQCFARQTVHFRADRPELWITVTMTAETDVNSTQIFCAIEGEEKDFTVSEVDKVKDAFHKKVHQNC